MTDFLDYLADRVLLCDGAMGTQVAGAATSMSSAISSATRTAPRS